MPVTTVNANVAEAKAHVTVLLDNLPGYPENLMCGLYVQSLHAKTLAWLPK